MGRSENTKSNGCFRSFFFSNKCSFAFILWMFAREKPINWETSAIYQRSRFFSDQMCWTVLHVTLGFFASLFFFTFDYLSMNHRFFWVGFSSPWPLFAFLWSCPKWHNNRITGAPSLRCHYQNCCRESLQLFTVKDTAQTILSSLVYEFNLF